MGRQNVHEVSRAEGVFCCHPSRTGQGGWLACRYVGGMDYWFAEMGLAMRRSCLRDPKKFLKQCAMPVNVTGSDTVTADTAGGRLKLLRPDMYVDGQGRRLQPMSYMHEICAAASRDMSYLEDYGKDPFGRYRSERTAAMEKRKRRQGRRRHSGSTGRKPAHRNRMAVKSITDPEYREFRKAHEEAAVRLFSLWRGRRVSSSWKDQHKCRKSWMKHKAGRKPGGSYSSIRHGCPGMGQESGGPGSRPR